MEMCEYKQVINTKKTVNTATSRLSVSIESYYCYIIVMGWKIWLNFKGKTNRLKVSLQNAYFY